MGTPAVPRDRRPPRPTGPRRRRRLRRWLVGGVAGLVLLALLGVLGVGWYFSDRALTVRATGQAELGIRDAGEGRAALSREGYADYLGEHGIRTPVGATSVEDAAVVGVVGDILEDDGDEVVRAWEATEGTLPEEPVRALIDQDVFWPDPSAVDVPFSEVSVPGELGGLPAWVVEGEGEAATTWVLWVHGWGATREEALRYLPALHEAGVTILVPTYRNDAGAPADPSGRYRLGESEWRDAEAALVYAREQGAEQVVVLGWSIGAAISLQMMDRSEEADVVSALWLDSPLLDWRHTFAAQGRSAGLPGPMTDVAVWIIALRAGLDLDDYDWVARAQDLPAVPIHIEHPRGDTFVPNARSVALAEARPDVVTIEVDSDADHTRAWNADPDGYDARLAAWLAARLDG
ncbi:alpha/beta hydrolase family protein [Ornithinimicrobium cerasi]|uniref:alpha/beta hydrolase family protein n=1 Tax=Ornithinimicrobium cerasi TaxID=2248773 RepID=UPI0014825611|nr:alpha/beta hydrolase [Ornithinimicrobium cerasi]